jgi:DNA repair exonuclease SbcCD ATPase subunit
MIFFKSLKFKNFLSTGNYFTEIKFDEAPNTLVVGTNGAGKSTMLDALCFVLFGKAFRNINKPQLINSINQKDCIVECFFTIGKKEYRIVRGIKPGIFEIYLNGEILNQEAASRDYQEILEKQILKLNYKSFTQIVILGSASFTPFMQLSAADRRAIIEELLDIQIFSTMNSLLKEKVSLNKDEITENKFAIELAEQNYENQKTQIEKLKQNNENKVKEYENEIASSDSLVQTLHVEVDRLTSNVSTLTEQISGKSEVENKVKKLNKLESQIETNLSKFRRDIHFFEANDNCPTCRQTIAMEFKETELSSITNKVKECEHGLSQLETKLLQEQDKLNAISEFQKQIQQLNIQIVQKNTTITETNKYIGKIRKEIQALKDNKTNLDLENTKLKELEDKLTELNSQKKKLIEEKAEYEVASILLKDTGIKTKIVKQYLPVINKLVNKYLATLDFFVNFNLDESFKETIKSRHRDEFSYASFSEGEKQRIDMALMLTWRAVAKMKNSTNTNLLILDEVFDSSLDANGTEYLMNLLHILEDVNLFVISHKGDILQDKFRNVIRFDKVNNFSRIVK